MSFSPLARMVATASIIAIVGCSKGSAVGHDAGTAGAGTGSAGTGGAGTGGAGTGGAGDTGTGGRGAGGMGALDAGPDANNGCNGICVPGPADFWDYPVLVFIGASKSDVPPCPPQAPAFGYEGYAELDAPTDCGTCTCGPAAGSCTLPTTMHANAASCAQSGPATPHTPFDPASGWDGACDTNDSIPSGKLCGGAKCVQSVTIGPLGVTETACTPSTPPAQKPPAWKTFVRACRKFPIVPCDYGHLCLPVPKESGYRVCMGRQGVQSCPSFSPYSEQFVFYDSVDDTRACSDCTCGAPAGGTCASTVSVYTDGACTTPAYTTAVSSSSTACHDVPAGSPLGSKSATAPVYTPGTCTPGGGQPTGAATPLHPVTFCCLPNTP